MNQEEKKSPFKNIAFYSSSPQQGKTQSAEHLIYNHGYERLSFATPINEMITTFLLEQGVAPGDIIYYMGRAKEDLIPGVGTSYRHLARTLGTEWGRERVNDSIWINAFITRFSRKRGPICVDDLRFRNELNCLKEHGFLFVKIERNVDRTGLKDTHQSDIDLQGFDDWDFVLKNNGTLGDLRKTLTEFIEA